MQLVIEPGLASSNYWRDVWRYRELMYFLAWRDLAVRYKQTVIGVAWALLRPALTMLVFVLFRRLMGAERGAVPDVVFVLAAVLPWQFFSSALSESAGSLVVNTNLIAKVYFPRLIVPAAAIATALVDFAITVALLAVVMAWQGVTPSWTLTALPLFLALALALAMGIGVLLAALNVRYRDFRYVVPFIVQVGLFVSPIAFSSENVPARWQPLYVMNPLAGIIDGFRWSILGGRTPLDATSLVTSVAITLVVLAIGVTYFRRTERSLADVI
jgi:lipopolysaccharide transport system permease protein